MAVNRPKEAWMQTAIIHEFKNQYERATTNISFSLPNPTCLMCLQAATNLGGYGIIQFNGDHTSTGRVWLNKD